MDQVKPKSNTLTIVVIILIILFVLGFGGYFISRYLANKALNAVANVIPTPSSASANNALPNKSWPSDMVAGVPKYTKGNIKDVVKLTSPKTWDILISDTTRADYDNYLAELKNAGWVSQGEVTLLADINQFKKDNWDLTTVFDPSSNGAKITITETVK